MGGFHVRNYAQVDCAELVAVADPSAEARGRALAGAQALEFGDWREMLGDADGLDAVSIACPSGHHAEIAIEAPSARPPPPGRPRSNRSPPASTSWSRSRSRPPCPMRCGCAAPRSRPTAS